MATNEQIETIIDESYIDTEKEQLDSVIKEEYNIEFEIKTLVDKMGEENMKSKRLIGEIKIFFMLQDYLKVINACSITPSFILKIVCLTYRKKKEHFEIVIYSADKWQQYFVSGISNILEENWIVEVGEEVTIDYSHSEIMKDKLYISVFLIPSKHLQESEMEFFYNNI